MDCNVNLPSNFESVAQSPLPYQSNFNLNNEEYSTENKTYALQNILTCIHA